MRPGLIHLARAHGVIRAFHAKRADIDMRDDDRHQHKGDDCVPKLGKLHLLLRGKLGGQDAITKPLRDAGVIEEGKGLGKERQFKREQQRQAGNGDGGPEQDDRPENHLLTGVELLCGGGVSCR